MYADDEGWFDYIAQAPDLTGSHLWCRITFIHFSLQVDLSIFARLSGVFSHLCEALFELREDPVPLSAGRDARMQHRRPTGGVPTYIRRCR